MLGLQFHIELHRRGLTPIQEAWDGRGEEWRRSEAGLRTKAALDAYKKLRSPALADPRTVVVRSEGQTVFTAPLDAELSAFDDERLLKVGSTILEFMTGDEKSPLSGPMREALAALVEPPPPLERVAPDLTRPELKMEDLRRYVQAAEIDQGRYAPDLKSDAWYYIAQYCPALKPFAEDRARRWRYYSLELAAAAELERRKKEAAKP